MRVIHVAMAKAEQKPMDFARYIRELGKIGIKGFKTPKIKGPDSGKVKMALVEGQPGKGVKSSKKYFVVVREKGGKIQFSAVTPGKENYKYDKVVKATTNFDTFMKAFLKVRGMGRFEAGYEEYQGRQSKAKEK